MMTTINEERFCEVDSRILRW